jgi:hypothetical protein
MDPGPRRDDGKEENLSAPRKIDAAIGGRLAERQLPASTKKIYLKCFESFSP